MWCAELLDLYSGFILLFIYADIHSNSLTQDSNLHSVIEFLAQSKDTRWEGMVTPRRSIPDQDYHPFNLFCQILEFYRVDKNLNWVPLRSRKRLLQLFQLATKFASIKILDVRTQSFIAIFNGFFKILVPIIQKNESDEARLLADMITGIVQSAVARQVDELTKKKINYFVQIYPPDSSFRFADKASNKALAPVKKLQLMEALKNGMRAMILQRRVMVKFDISELFMTEKDKYRRFAEEQRRIAEQKARRYEMENQQLVRRIQEIRAHQHESERQNADTLRQIYEAIPSPRSKPPPVAPIVKPVPIPPTDAIRVQDRSIPTQGPKLDITPKISDQTRLELLNIQKDMRDFMATLK